MKTKSELTDDQLVHRCYEWIDKLCKTGGKDWSLRVPVDFDNDPDMLFLELISRFKNASREVTAYARMFESEQKREEYLTTQFRAMYKRVLED